MNAYEKLGLFYLGKRLEAATGKRGSQPLLYDARDLLTHAVIIGMTGSGKTGLGIALLEEALIDNIPIIAIDPKGDLPNLLLQFPQLRAEDFQPWIQPADALRQGLSVEQLAVQTAGLWGKGLADWDQSAERIARLQAACEGAVYTPGSTAGRPVGILRSFAAPAPEIRHDPDFYRERIQSTTTALLTLLGIDADPLTSREHILLANIFDQLWSVGRNTDLAGLIRDIQQPPVERIGVMDLESFYPAGERFQLALRLNNLLAAPGFETWLAGDPLDIESMLYAADGRPRAVIFSISHLSDAERMFFVSLLLGEVLAWMRKQPGTSSLRALLYMDEIHGYFPPVKNPPSKMPLLTLLKQARAYGLGVVLSTQNPVDLDYKGLSNTGTWFIGRLQTENDRDRVMAGLQGTAAGKEYESQRVEEMLSTLGKRKFLLHSVHASEPLLFETRWVLSYLAGPMTREQIKRIYSGQLATTPAIPEPVSGPLSGEIGLAAAEPPLMPPGVPVFYLPASGAGKALTYLPAVGGWTEIRYFSARQGVDEFRTHALAAPLAEGTVSHDWNDALMLSAGPSDLAVEPMAGAVFSPLPTEARNVDAYPKWNREYLRWVRQNRPLVLLRSKRFDLVSRPQESETAFRARLSQAAREQRDLAVEKLRNKYADRYRTLRDRLMRAEQALEREQDQVKAKKMESVVSFGAAILGAFLGRRGTGTVSRVGTAVKSAGRLGKEQQDVERARETVAAVKQQMAELETRVHEEIEKLENSHDPATETLQELRINARSSDIVLKAFGLLWLPYRRSPSGGMEPDWQR
ncbi:MAG TPA: ATP-binding protein [Desulfobacterales bacterium]